MRQIDVTKKALYWSIGGIRAETYGLEHPTPVNGPQERYKEDQAFYPVLLWKS